MFKCESLLKVNIKYFVIKFDKKKKLIKILFVLMSFFRSLMYLWFVLLFMVRNSVF